MGNNSITKQFAELAALGSFMLPSQEPARKRERQWYNPKPADPEKKKKRKMKQASKKRNRR